MSVFIAGGCGFIGLNLAEAWLRRGEHVVLFDRNPLHVEAARAFAALPGSLEVVQGDVQDAAMIGTALNAAAPDVVFYGAALTSGPDRERTHPEQVLGVNLMGLTHVLTAAAARPVTRLINISSGAAYGPSRLGVGWSGPLREEETPSAPDSLYGISKLASEQVVRRYAALSGLDAISVRLAAIYGPWEIDSGARDTLSPQMQAALLALDGGTAILPRRDRQDWTYSRDVAAALVALAKAPELAHDLYHVSCGTGWAVADWCARLGERYPDFSYRLAEAGEAPTVNLHGDKDRLPMSTERLVRDVGHRLPDDLDLCLTDYLDWMQAHAAFWRD